MARNNTRIHRELAAEIADRVFGGDDDAIMFDNRGLNFTISELIIFMSWIELNPVASKKLYELLEGKENG